MSEEKTKIPYELVLDGTIQLIQICDEENLEMMYANQSARMFTAHSEKDYHGEKCYRYMMGLEEQCPFCPLLQMKDLDIASVEIDNGNQVFSVQTKRIKVDGRVAFIEYATDITKIRRAQKVFESQIKTLLESLPDAQGIFHLNLTKNIWISSNGVAKAAKNMRESDDIDVNIRKICEYVPDEEERNALYEKINRNRLLSNFKNGKTKIFADVNSLYDDNKVRWTRLTVRIMMNPDSGDIEAVIYGRDISGEKELREQIHKANLEKAMISEKSKQDFLTGLFNKVSFEEEVENNIAQNPSLPKAFIFMDLDNFKEVNDLLGHYAGDQAIIQTAERLRGIFCHNEILSRFGGDEFCIFLPNASSLQLVQYLQMMLKQFTKTYKDADYEVNTTTSIGAVLCTREIKNVHDMVDAADKALYQAKRNGRNCYEITKR